MGVDVGGSVIRLRRPDAGDGCCRPEGRFEVTTVGNDPRLQTVGGDPYNSSNFSGLIVPAAGTASITPAGSIPAQFRYLFMLARYSVGINDRVRLVGLRQFASLLGGLVDSSWQGELQITSPMWRFATGENISWHVMAIPQRYLDQRNPANADSVRFRDSKSPALLFQTLTPYQPPNAGRPWGKPLRSDLGNIHDMRYPWRDSQTETELDVPCPPGFDVALFCSVFQRSTNTGGQSFTTNQLNAVAPEDRWWSVFGTSVQFYRVAGGLIFQPEGA